MKKVAMSNLMMAISLTLAVSASPWVYGSECTKHGDIQDIGNRSVSGKIWGILPNFVSFEREIALGAQVAAQFEQTARMVEDPVISEYVDRVGQTLVKHSDAKVPFHIKVVDTDEVNAFAFPGGYFYVNKGLLLAADNEAELAAPHPGTVHHDIGPEIPP